MRRHFLHSLVLLLFATSQLSAQSLDARQAFFVASMDAHGNAIKHVDIDPATGKIRAIKEIFRDDTTRVIESFVLSADGRRIAFVNREDELEEHRAIYLLSASLSPIQARKIKLSRKPETALFWGDKIIVFTSGGIVHLIDHESGRIETTATIRELVNPPAHQIHSIHLAPDRDLLICVMKEDAPGGKRFGSRLIGVHPSNFTLIFDLRLDRRTLEAAIPAHDANLLKDVDALSFGVQSRMQGSGPNGLAFSPATNSAAITLDNYGSILLCDLDALLTGKLVNARLLSPVDKAGTWFPDAPVHISTDGRDFFIVPNAGLIPQVTIVDPKTRSIAHQLPLEPSSSLFWSFELPQRKSIVFTRSGYFRKRGEDNIIQDHKETNDIVMISFANPDAPTLSSYSFDEHVYHVARPSMENENFIFVAFMNGETRQMRFGTVETATGRLVDTVDVTDVVRGTGFATITPSH